MISPVSEPQDNSSRRKWSKIEIHQDHILLVIREASFEKMALDFKFHQFKFVDGTIHYLTDLNESRRIVQSELEVALTNIYTRIFTILSTYEDEIDKFEDGLFDRKGTHLFIDFWVELKRDLSRLERYLNTNIRIVEELMAIGHSHKVFLSKKFLLQLKELLKRSSSLNKDMASRLNDLYSFNQSIKDEKLNRSIFVLTLVSAIFLPLNLLVGYFGMNTENLPFKSDPMGTQKVTTLIFIILAILIFGLPTLKILDNYFLRIFLGRFDVYKRLSQRINNLLKID